MSEREDLDTDLTSYSLDDEDQLQPGDSLMGSGTADEDPLDAGYSPPDSARGSYAHGVTAAEQREGESIDQLSLIHISEPTRRLRGSRMPSSA